MTTKHFITLICLCICILGCVQQAHKKTVIISLDMRDIDQPKNVGIRGQFPLSWEETTLLEDKDGDGIYEGYFEFYTAQNEVEFKFVNQDNSFELKDQPNRSISFEYKPEQMTYRAKFNDPDGELKKD